MIAGTRGAKSPPPADVTIGNLWHPAKIAKGNLQWTRSGHALIMPNFEKYPLMNRYQSLANQGVSVDGNSKIASGWHGSDNGNMKTKIELPDEMAQRLESIANRRRTTVTRLVLEGLELAYRKEPSVSTPEGALHRLRAGYHLGGKPLSRDQVHEC